MTPDEVLWKARVLLHSSSQLFPDEGRNALVEESLRDLIALAERQQEALVDATAKYIALSGWYVDDWEALAENDTPELAEENIHGKNFYRAQARRELSIQKRPRLTAEERDAMRDARDALEVVCMIDGRTSLEVAERHWASREILRKMLEG